VSESKQPGSRGRADASRHVLSEQEMAIYRAAAERQHAQEAKELVLRRERAWERARQAATLLKQNFGAERVAVFGSLLRPDCFNRWSDVDIAAWGINLRDTFRAIGAVMDLGEDIEINLVDMNTCRDTLRHTIEVEGHDL